MTALAAPSSSRQAGSAASARAGRYWLRGAASRRLATPPSPQRD